MIRYLETFFRNRWIISIPALLLLFSGAGLAVFSPKKDTAAAKIWTEAPVYFDIQLSKNPYLTPATIQANRFDELVGTDTFAKAIVDLTPVGQNGSEKAKDELISAIHKGLTVSSSGDHIVRISFTYEDPEVALAVVKRSIEVYNRVTAESADLQAEQAIAFYKDRVKTYETEVVPRSQKAVTEYLDAHPEVRRNVRDGGPADPTYALLQERFQADRDQYDSFRTKLEDIQTRSEAVSKNQEAMFRIMDAPGLLNPGGATLSKKTLILFAGVGAGVSMGYAAFFLLLATELDQTMRNPGDIRRRLQIPVLEVIPEYGAQGVGQKRRRNKRRASTPVGGSVPSQVGG